jgi:hypothetical protein
MVTHGALAALEPHIRISDAHLVTEVDPDRTRRADGRNAQATVARRGAHETAPASRDAAGVGPRVFLPLMRAGRGGAALALGR